jgi:hypothetical protein
MTIITSGRLQVSETSDRQRAAFNLRSDGTQLGVTGGVQGGLGLTKTAGLGWSLDLGRAAIPAATAANGAVLATVTVAETGAWAAGDATRDRIDILTLMIDETATVANGNPPVKVNIIQGAYPASGGPVAPVVPAGQLPLWQEYIAAGTSAGTGWDTTKLTDLRQTLINGNPDGAFAMFSGTQTVAMLTTQNYQTQVVTIPAGIFTKTPKVFAQVTGAPGGNAGKINAHVTAGSATGFTLALYTGDGTNPLAAYNIAVDWFAVQVAP